ncbi:hypothetical protein, partial [Microbispora sp. CSR-4]|uniref:hypothetical protein n=1 Tax=Microbispora sp. CSR-4 TaxID=2592813 RepID=UPI001C9D0965
MTLDLARGESKTIDKTVSTPVVPPKPDIAFLIDTTGSMGGVISNVRTNANAIFSNEPISSSGGVCYPMVLKDRDGFDQVAGLARATS